MIFTSTSYFIFLPIIFLANYYCADRYRWLVLLGSSFYFYSTFKAPHLIAILVIVTFLTYCLGIILNKIYNPYKRLCLLWCGIGANLIVLIIIKVLPLIETHYNYIFVRTLFSKIFQNNTAIVTIGTSFFIFQAISYLIDVYHRVLEPEGHIGYFALYMSFFPKLLLGPIERAGYLLPQLRQPYSLDHDNIRTGISMVALGLLKKVVIADRLALLVDPIFSNVSNYKGLQLLLACYYYSLQIYFDFSGYTDMALGAALLFNIKLTQNFCNPYFATSIADFWRRWHISFSRWIMDYIFTPLQMSLRSFGFGTVAALLITFVLTGIWHGINWGFLVWGLLHGIYMVAYALYKPHKKFVHKLFSIDAHSVVYKVLCTFVVFNLVSFAWIFFRANTISDAKYILFNISFRTVNSLSSKLSLSFIIENLNLYFGPHTPSPGADIVTFMIMLVFIGILLYVDGVGMINLLKKVFKYNMMIRYSFYSIILLCIMFFCIVDNSKFVYGNF